MNAAHTHYYIQAIAYTNKADSGGDGLGSVFTNLVTSNLVSTFKYIVISQQDNI